MATIYWKCNVCGRMNQRRGIEDNSARLLLRCPRCKSWNRMVLKWACRVIRQFVSATVIEPKPNSYTKEKE